MYVPGSFLGVMGNQNLRPTISSPTMNQLSRKFVSLNFSQPYRPPWPVTVFLAQILMISMFLIIYRELVGVEMLGLLNTCSEMVSCNFN
jgi:hypothetical protein